MIENIYIIMGIKPPIGPDDYEQRWLVAAYPEKELAKQHCVELMKVLNGPLTGKEAKELIRKTIDPHEKLRPTWGNKYEVIEVPLCLHLDQFKERFGLV